MTQEPGYGPLRRNHLILGFFFLTGLTGLAYELVWIRLLILAFGSTQFAVTTVLVTFMSGIALGSLIFGRIVDRSRSPLKVYAAIEAALGIYCILSPTVFLLVKNLYVKSAGVDAAVQVAGFEFSQFALSFMALIIPTTLMGGTLPVLVKYLASASGRVGFHTAVPYAVNTLGAVTGCLATGFLTLYMLGVTTTVYAAGVIDIIIGALVYFIYDAKMTGAAAGETEPAAAERLAHGHAVAGHKGYESTLGVIIITSFAVSGFCSLAYEVLWTRIFSLVLGSSVYAFTVMLATFLAGIGFGSLIFSPFVDRLKKPVFWFGVFEVLIGLTGLLTIFIYRKLPFIFFNMKEAFAERFWIFLLLQFLLCSAIMIIPTLSMGAIFPLVGRIYTRGIGTVGRNIGDVYFFNTSGSIFGAFIGGFILIPVTGAQNGVILVAGINILLAVVLFISSGLRATAKASLGVALVLIFVVVANALPTWEKTLMTMGLYVNPVESEKVEHVRVEGRTPEKLLYYKEGINAVITVRSEGMYLNKLTYQANGKQEAMSVGGKPPEAWALLGHIPLLLHNGKPKDALLVGLGSGVTLGAMGHYPLSSIEVVEIEPAVVEAAAFFKDANDNALEDPRAKIHITDGRSFLFASTKSYDVIVSAVSDPWITGVANLFTFEYFNELKSKLNPGGVVSLWFQNYRVTPKELKIGLNTFASVFPYVSIWFHYTDSLDLIVIGSLEPHGLDLERLERLFAEPGIGGALGRIGVKTPLDVFDLFIIGNTDLRRYTGKTVLNTDERPIFEFTLPKLLYLDPATGIKTVEELIDNSHGIIPPVTIQKGDEEQFYLALGKSYNRYNFRLGQALKLFNKVIEINPANKEAARYALELKKELNYRPGAVIR